MHEYNASLISFYKIQTRKESLVRGVFTDRKGCLEIERVELKKEQMEDEGELPKTYIASSSTDNRSLEAYPSSHTSLFFSSVSVNLVLFNANCLMCT